jgi:hypothetical protein
MAKVQRRTKRKLPPSQAGTGVLINLDDKMVKRLAKYQKQIGEYTGMKVGNAPACKRLVEIGLNAWEQSRKLTNDERQIDISDVIK